MKKALMMASVASMIDLFNMDNIQILEDLGFQVEIACNFEKGSITSQERVDQFKAELQQDNYKIYQLPVPRNIFAISDILKSYKMMKTLCRENHYDLIHCHSPIGGMIARLAARKAMKKGTKIIYTAHGFHFFKGAPRKNWLLYYPVEKYLSRYTDLLITINQEDFQLAFDKNFKAGQILHVRGVGVDLEKFSPPGREKKTELRKKHNYSDQAFILIYVGELSYRKHQDLLIRAVHLLKDKIPRIKLLLVGNGDLYEEYYKLAQALCVHKQVEFLGYRSDVPELMALADLSVSASRQEGLAVNLMEAMATGLPLVVSASRGQRDLIVPGENGILYQVDDLEKLSQGILQLYQDQALREQYGRKSLELISSYSIESINAEMKKIYSAFL